MPAIHKLAAAAVLQALVLCNGAPTSAQHDHPIPEKLGKVNFPVSCSRAVQASFNHAAALLHSFAYTAAQKEFAAIAERDPQCAMAYWGIAASYYHQLWEPIISPSDLESGAPEIQKAETLSANASDREQAFIHALAIFYNTASRSSVRNAALAYTNAMRDVASQNEDDLESQIFYALAFLSIASPADTAHTNQKWAAQILEPLFHEHPDHPGIAHYLIHAYDHPDLAQQGLAVARTYSKIAPSAPHALHMPAHIFTLLGMWPDSIKSNLAARAAAHQLADIGEELHAMDYLMYAYLQAGRFDDAAKLLADLQGMQSRPINDTCGRGQQTADCYKVAYASTIIPVRFAVERRQWNDALNLSADPQAPPQFRAIAEWANIMGAARYGKIPEAEQHLHNLQELLAEVRQSGDNYWTSQVQIQVSEAEGWLANAQGDRQKALAPLRVAAELEDRLAKRPITPGPAIPAREQLGDLLLEINQPAEALREYQLVRKHSPSRRNALISAAKAAQLSSDSAKSLQFQQQLKSLR